MPWDPSVSVPGHSSRTTPALAEFNGELHMVHLDSSGRGPLFHSRWNGTEWMNLEAIPEVTSIQAAPALATFNNRLHLIHLGGTPGFGKLYHL